MSGALAGATSLLIMTPLQLATTVLGADVLAPELGRTTYQYAGMADVLSKTLQHSGPLGLFNGFGVSVAGIVLYRGTYFGLYDSLRPLVPQNNFLASFLMGWGVTIIAGLATYPLDTIRYHSHLIYFLSLFKSFIRIIIIITRRIIIIIEE
jgi:solute carrier family 25 (adenine nucleotide translocator) protein 4/5/6/31